MSLHRFCNLNCLDDGIFFQDLAILASFWQILLAFSYSLPNWENFRNLCRGNSQKLLKFLTITIGLCITLSFPTIGKAQVFPMRQTFLILVELRLQLTNKALHLFLPYVSLFRVQHPMWLLNKLIALIFMHFSHHNACNTNNSIGIIQNCLGGYTKPSPFHTFH